MSESTTTQNSPLGAENFPGDTTLPPRQMNCNNSLTLTKSSTNIPSKTFSERLKNRIISCPLTARTSHL